MGSQSRKEDPAIVTRDLRRDFGDVTAVEGIDMTVERGTVYGFLGPNGAGKTTTIRMLTGLLHPSGGDARVCGVPVENRTELAERIGHLPESPPLYPELTAREQLTYMTDLRDLSDEANERATEMLDRFGLEADADRRIETYSTGMKKKVGITQALLHDPEVLFMDEPTSGLDPRAARTVREIIDDLTDREMTVLLSSHVLGVVEEIADEVGVLADGRLIEEARPEALVARVETGPAGDGEGATLEDAFLEITHDLAPET
jgi:ABC-2 type transport system ATP-binding protein